MSDSTDQGNGSLLFKTESARLVNFLTVDAMYLKRFPGYSASGKTIFLLKQRYW